MCRECFPGPATQPASLLPLVHGFPVLRVLPASPTSTVASVSLRLIHSVDILGPFSTDQDGGGSPRCHDASVSVHAVLSDPAGFSGDHRLLSVAYCCLPDIRPCRHPDVSRGSIASRVLRPGHRSVYA